MTNHLSVVLTDFGLANVIADAEARAMRQAEAA